METKLDWHSTQLPLLPEIKVEGEPMVTLSVPQEDTAPFKVGDFVRVIFVRRLSVEHDLLEKAGKVISISDISDDIIGVEFAFRHPLFHSCDGYAKADHGYYMLAKDLAHVDDN